MLSLCVRDTETLTVSISGEMDLPDRFRLDTGKSQLGRLHRDRKEIWNRQVCSAAWIEQAPETNLGVLNPLMLLTYMNY